MTLDTLPSAEEIADRIGVLDHGKVQFLGTMPELRTRLSSDESSLEHLYLTLTDGEQDAATQEL